MDLRYPIGRFQFEGEVSAEQGAGFIEAIETLPAALRAAVNGLSEEQLDTPYRPDGWTVRQVVHHLADSHINSFVRFKLAITEDEPAIKTYQEALWAETPDARTAPVEASLALIESLHARWGILLRSLTPSDLRRAFRHPEHGLRTLGWNLALYAWHGAHHAAHITSLRERMGWPAAGAAAN